tara:strand:- start:766 stop:1440 length:675 start_codon:yes stop_codon:yes gene_type:complete
MAKELLREFYALCPDGNCVLDVLTESEKKRMNEGSVFLVGVCQKAGVKNGNGRIYRKDILQREIENYQKAIGERRALGELDHPDDSVINLKNASHLITKMWWDGDNVMGKVEVLGTPSGQVLKELINAGVKLGISSRGLGSVKNQNGNTIVEDDFQLICFDMVSDPSTPGAYLSHQKPKKLTASPAFNPLELMAMPGLAENNLNEVKKIDKVKQSLNEILKSGL